MRCITKLVATGMFLGLLFTPGLVRAGDDAAPDEARTLRARIEALTAEAKAADADGWETLAATLRRRIEHLEGRLRAVRHDEASGREARQAVTLARHLFGVLERMGRAAEEDAGEDLDADEARAVTRSAEHIVRFLFEPQGLRLGSPQSQRALHAFRRAFTVLQRADEHDAAALLERSIRALEALDGVSDLPDDPEAAAALVASPSADDVAAVLEQAVARLEAAGRVHSAGEVRRLVQEMQSLSRADEAARVAETAEPVHVGARARLLELEAKATALEQVAKELRREIRALREDLDE